MKPSKAELRKESARPQGDTNENIESGFGSGSPQSHAAFCAETAWEKLDHGIDVIRQCAGDLEKYCKGVTPGEGHVKACVAGHLADFSPGCLKALAEPAPQVLSDGANAKSQVIQNSHLTRFAKIFLAAIDPNTGHLVAECYGTYAAPDAPGKKDSAPQALVEKLDLDQIKKQYGVLGASLNGPKLWLPDSYEALSEFREVSMASRLHGLRDWKWAGT